MYKLEFTCLKGLNTLNPRNEEARGIFQARRDVEDPAVDRGADLIQVTTKCSDGTSWDDRAVCHRWQHLLTKQQAPGHWSAGENWVPCQRCYKNGSSSLEPMTLQGSSEDMRQSAEQRCLFWQDRFGEDWSNGKEGGSAGTTGLSPSTGPRTVLGSLPMILGISILTKQK